MDKRLEHLQDYIDIVHTFCNWEGHLGGYQVNALLLQTDLHPELIAAITTSSYWQRASADEIFLVIEQRGGT